MWYCASLIFFFLSLALFSDSVFNSPINNPIMSVNTALFTLNSSPSQMNATSLNMSAESLYWGVEATAGRQMQNNWRDHSFAPLLIHISWRLFQIPHRISFQWKKNYGKNPNSRKPTIKFAVVKRELQHVAKTWCTHFSLLLCLIEHWIFVFG